MKETNALDPITAYGASKAWATLYAKYLAFSKKTPITTLRLFGVYGFYESRGRLIPNIILAFLKNDQPAIISPHFLRDFVFVDDVVNAYLKAAEKKFSNLVFNIGSGKQTTLLEIFIQLKKILKVEIEPVWENHSRHLFDTNRRIADIKLAKKHLGWKPQTNLLVGLKQTAEWFKRNKSLYE
jgi:nucleoside-diphosphate-sugar epimerase